MVLKLQYESDREGVLRAYGKSEDDLQDYKRIIYDWLRQQAHLPKIGDTKLEVMLITAKFSLEKTKRRIEKYYTIRRIEPAYFENWDIKSPAVHTALRTYAVVPMPKMTADKCHLYIMRVLDSNQDNFNPVELYKTIFMFTEMLFDYGYVMGHHFVWDMEHIKFGHMAKVTPTLIHKFMTISSDCYTIRFTGMHIINGGSFIDTILNMCKLGMKPKLFNRIKVHKNLESLQKEIPKELLPKEYGGDLPPFAELHAQLLERLDGMRDKFIDEMKILTDESKRVGKLDLDGIYGSIAGSFRKLQVD